jgi:Thymidylate synthase.
MLTHDSDDMTLALAAAPVDPRTGNRVIYSVSWKATKPSMIGEVNPDWVRRELDWFMSGSDKLEDMEGPVPQLFQACAGWDGRVNSAYGHILFGRGDYSDRMPQQGPPLFDRVVDTFIMQGPATRHAVAIISDRDIHTLASYNGRTDFICTNALNFMIDSEDKLHIIAQMRSMDAVFGYRADYSMWDALMEYLLGNLERAYPNLQRGDITFQVANLHVYPRHFKLLEEWADKVDGQMSREMHQFWGDRSGTSPRLPGDKASDWSAGYPSTDIAEGGQL